VDQDDRAGQSDDFPSLQRRRRNAGVFSRRLWRIFSNRVPISTCHWESELKEVVALLAANKWPFRLHATYDESITRFLNVFEEVNRDVPFKGSTGSSIIARPFLIAIWTA